MTELTLIGMYYCMSDQSNEFFRTGRIVQEIKDGVFLCRPDNMSTKRPQPLLHVIDLAEMLGDTEDHFPITQLFRTRKAMNAELYSERNPSTARVLSIVPKAKEE